MHFLISGIPASGKSTFCRWLEENKGFLHLNVEEDGVLERHGLATAWEALFDKGATAAPFVEALERFKRPVAIDWGFPPECLDIVRKLFDAGVMLWWFAADWAVARRKFKERGTLPVELFDIQIRKNRRCSAGNQHPLSLAQGLHAALHRHLHPTGQDLGKHARHPGRTSQ